MWCYSHTNRSCLPTVHTEKSKRTLVKKCSRCQQRCDRSRSYLVDRVLQILLQYCLQVSGGGEGGEIKQGGERETEERREGRGGELSRWSRESRRKAQQDTAASQHSDNHLTIIRERENQTDR